MTGGGDILTEVRAAARKRLLFTAHAVQQMTRPERMITHEEVRGAAEHGEVIEDYPEDPRGRSCLILAQGASRRPVHVVCSPRDEYLVVVTAYLPDPGEWSPDFRRRLAR